VKVWILQYLDCAGGYLGFTDGAQARRTAERIVGNRAAAHAPGVGYLYGPGDGSTSVMVRDFDDDELARKMFPDAFPKPEPEPPADEEGADK
jgi:hypothetical protein